MICSMIWSGKATSNVWSPVIQRATFAKASLVDLREIRPEEEADPCPCIRVAT